MRITRFTLAAALVAFGSVVASADRSHADLAFGDCDGDRGLLCRTETKEECVERRICGISPFWPRIGLITCCEVMETREEYFYWEGDDTREGDTFVN